MPPFENVASLAVKMDVPVLFLDTCVLLDIVRLAIDRRFQRGEAEAAKKLWEVAAGANPSCLLVVASLISKEWEDNVEKERKNGIEHIAKIDHQLNCFHEACLGLGVDVGQPKVRYADLGLVENLVELSKQLLDTAVRLDRDEGCRSRASDRAIERIPPALLKSELKDCIIIEEYLAVCRELKPLGHRKRRVFCTSNKADYCLDSELYPRLAADFADVGLEFSMKLALAVHKVQTPSPEDSSVR